MVLDSSDTCFDFKQHTGLLSGLNVQGDEKKALILGGGRHIDFSDIGLSLASDMLFPPGSDYLCVV